MSLVWFSLNNNFSYCIKRSLIVAGDWDIVPKEVRILGVPREVRILGVPERLRILGEPEEVENTCNLQRCKILVTYRGVENTL